jgi:hypothetical protein
MMHFNGALAAVDMATTVLCGILLVIALSGVVYHWYASVKRHPVVQTLATCAVIVAGTVGLYLAAYSGKLVLLKMMVLRTSITTTVVCGAILVITLASVLARFYHFHKKRPPGPIVQLSPGAIISLGIFGTFLGIYIGLLDFDTSDIHSSIPSLLEGLKTAFITSLFGMFFSLFLKYVYGIFDRLASENPSSVRNDPVAILKGIEAELSALSMEVKSVQSTFLRCFQSDESFSLVSQVDRIRSDLHTLKDHLAGTAAGAPDEPEPTGRSGKDGPDGP